MNSAATPPTVPNAQLTHIGILVRDMDNMIAFYQRVMGMKLIDRGAMGPRELAFLSRSPEEHHQLVLVCDPTTPSPEKSTVGQLAFRIDDLEGLRTYWRLLGQWQLPGLEGRNHGNSWSLYFFDPEGNKIELYVSTPWQFKQPWREPLDLTQPADAIVARTEQLFRETPGTTPLAQWQAAW